MNKQMQAQAISVEPEVARQALYMFVVSLYSFVAAVAITVQAANVA